MKKLFKIHHISL